MTELFAFVFISYYISLLLYFYFYNGYYCSLKLTFNKKGRLALVIVHFIMHTVKIIRVYVHILFKPLINVLYFEENKMVVVFDIIFCGYYYFKLNRKETMLFDIANICFTVMYVRSLNYIFAAINVFT